MSLQTETSAWRGARQPFLLSKVNSWSLNGPLRAIESVPTDRESNFRGKVPYQDIERRKWRGHQYSICPIRPSENGDLIMAPQNVRLSRSQSDRTEGGTDGLRVAAVFIVAGEGKKECSVKQTRAPGPG